MKEPHREYAAVVILAFLVLCFCQDLVLHGHLPFYRDLTNYFYPLRYSLFESFRAGELPLWNRHFAQGFPNLAAFQSGAFYPAHFVFLLFPFFTSIRALFVLHFLIAATGSYALLRSWNYPRDLSVVGALLFTLGGVTVSLANLLNHFQSAVWLPWVILTWEHLLRSSRWSKFVILTFTLALQFLAGSPEIFAMSMVLVLLDGFRMRAKDPELSMTKIVGFAIAGTLCMLSLTMAQLLPTAELTLESRRGQSIPSAEAFMWSFHPSSLWNLFFLDKEVDISLLSGTRLFFQREVPFLITKYLGLISAFGMLLWLYYAERREKIFLTALVVGSFSITLGANALVYPFLFQYVPFVSLIRFPEKFFFLTNLLLVLMVMGGLKEFLTDTDKSSKVPSIIFGGICLVWLGLYTTLSVRSDILANFIAEYSGGNSLSNAEIINATVTVLTNLQRQVILALAIVALLVLRRTEKIRSALFSILLVSVVFVDLTWAQRGFLMALHPDRISQRPPLFNPSEYRETRYFYYPSSRDLHPWFFTFQGRPNFEEAVALSFENYLPNVGALDGLDYFQELDALSRRPYRDFLLVANSLDFNRQVALLRTFNVGYIVSLHQLPERGIRQIGRFPDYFSWLYQVEGTVPRAYVVNDVVVEKEPLRGLERLSDLDFDPLKRAVVYEDLPLHATSPLQAKVDIERYGNTMVNLRAQTNSESILILADSYYPGWKAFLNGRETKIFRANHFYRAVFLPEGTHRIEFLYEPWSFKVGMIISLSTLSFMIMISIFLFLRQRRVHWQLLARPSHIVETVSIRRVPGKTATLASLVKLLHAKVCMKKTD